MADSTERHDWDPSDPAVQADPFTAHERLRARCPVAHSNQWGGFWTLTKYEDIRQVSADRDNFTATLRTIVPSSPRKGLLPRYPLQADPPEQVTYRRALGPYFAERNVAYLEPSIREMTAALLAPLLTGEPVDVVTHYTEEVPVRALCRFVGLDDAEAARLKALSFQYVEAVQGQDLPVASRLSEEIDAFAIGLVDDRKRAPREPATDVTSGLLAARIDGRSFSDIEVAGMIRTLLIGGHTVPKNFLGSALRYLAEHPELQQRLRDQPSLLMAAIDEMLRLFSPNQALARTTTKDVCIRGQTIPAGQPVALLFLSANRDEEIFPDPGEFKLDRPPNRHIAFGTGIHACIGKPFALMQLRLALEEVLARTSRFEVVGEVRNATWPEYGVAAMSMRLYPAIGAVRG